MNLVQMLLMTGSVKIDRQFVESVLSETDLYIASYRLVTISNCMLCSYDRD